MTYTETQLEAIKIFGRKDLSFGCILKTSIYEGIDFMTLIGKEILVKYIDKNNECIFFSSEDCSDELKNSLVMGDYNLEFDESSYDILGHTPHLDDLFLLPSWYGFELVRRSGGYFLSNTDCRDSRGFEEIPYDIKLPFIDQPSLPEIISYSNSLGTPLTTHL